MIYLYYIYFILIALPLIVIETILASLVTIIGCSLGNGEFWGYYPAMIWARIFAWLSLVRVRVKGRENVNKNTSYVFVANHQGAYDIFAIYGYLGHKFNWMMKKSLRKIFLVGAACEKAGHIFVDRKNPAGIKQTIETARKRLRGGVSLVVFPEGSRSYDGKLSQFKKGAYQLALQFNLPLVPITIDGAFKVMPRTAKLPRPGVITLTIHKPIDAPSTEEERDKAIEETRKRIESALPIKIIYND